MREIRYRGKRVDNGEWAYGNLIYDNIADKYWIILSINESEKIDGGLYIYAVEVIPETIGQYTGLHDKKGQEIYEGDIVLYKDWEMATENGSGDMFINKGIVEYNESNCCFNITERQTIDNLDVLFEDTDCIEVIGNIYENKELLEG